MKMRSTMDHKFSEIPSAEIPRSTFDRSHGCKTAFDAGFLVPVLVDEVLPGDTISCKMATFARLATPLHPILDNMHLESFFFFIPNRLLWDNWHKFMGEEETPGDSTDFTIPQKVMQAPGLGDLPDYLGIPKQGSVACSNLWGRGYHLLWNEWFRSEDLQDPVVFSKGDGPDSPGTYDTLLRRGKRHDYFTSCLPFPQKGVAEPLIVSGTVPVVPAGDGIPSFVPVAGSTTMTLFGSSSVQEAFYSANPDEDGIVEWSDPKLEADMSLSTSNTINQLRTAFAIQKMNERDARGGTRYTEIVRSHFGVTSPDQRLQRPEYLGGGYQNIAITPVPTTSQSGGTVGDLAGYGTSSGDNHGFTKSFTEHGIIIGLVCVRADLNYQQGLPRMFRRLTRNDFYFPSFAHLGEQAVLNEEIFADGTANDQLVFGYNERWSEYRYKPSMITGQMRSTHTTPLDTWHLAQDFSTVPSLNAAFIEDTPPVDRVIAVPSEPHFLFDAYFKYIHTRPIPTYSVPGQIDRF